MILTCGESLIDMLPTTDTEARDAFHPAVGGAVFNTAIALGRLGHPVGFFNGVSEDLFGERIMAELTRSGVDPRFVVRLDRPCTLAFVTLTDGQAKYAFYDENTAGRMLSEADLPTADALAGVTALFFGGISLVVEPCGASYEALALREAAAGERLTMLDPNIRTGFIRDETAYRARLDRMIASADIVKLSDEDLDWIAGTGDMAAQAQSILAKGARVVIVTSGANGAQAWTATGLTAFAPTTPAEVVDTVGAGDTFNAGLLADLQRQGVLSKTAIDTLSEDALTQAMAFANKVAGVVVARAGANPPWAKEL